MMVMMMAESVATKFTSVARVTTPTPARYLGQLCKHFAHKIPATHDAETGRIEFPFGVCELATGKDLLVLCVSAIDLESLARMEDVIGSHLTRFAFREPVEINWSRSDA
jgi:uncharacterized protein